MKNGTFGFRIRRGDVTFQRDGFQNSRTKYLVPLLHPGYGQGKDIDFNHLEHLLDLFGSCRQNGLLMILVDHHTRRGGWMWSTGNHHPA